MSNYILHDFDPRDFLKGGLIGAIGYKPDFKITLDAMEWHKLGYLEVEDLAEISAAIEAHKAAAEVEEVTPEEPTEEPTEPVEEPTEEPTETVEA
jgi:hypothetical protein